MMESKNMEELKEGWERVKLSEVIEFNPKETLKKNTISTYIEMANLQCFSRNILGYEKKEYKGGTKFRNGDTLLARITPCLENGKTAYIDCLEKNEIAFGSTEYIIMREKEKVTNSKFVYYLAISNKFRELAIKSMTGTSGRQRVQIDVLINSEINLPPLEIQEKIASILSALDDKIEINNEMNKTLEEMAQVLFKRWFIDFEFPNGEGKPYKSSGGKMVESELGEIPDGWEVNKIEELCTVTSSKRVFMSDYVNKGIPFFRSKEIIEKSKGENISTELFIAREKYEEIKKKFGVPSKGDILLTSVGTLGVSVLVDDEKFYFKDGNLTWFKDFKVLGYSNYIYSWLNYGKGKIQIDMISIGSTQKALTISGLKNMKLINPCEKTLKRYNKILESTLEQLEFNIKERNTLTEIRDTLLPKLMSGELEI